LIGARLRRRLRGEASIDELIRAFSVRLPDRLEAAGGRTVIGAGNRLDSIVLLGRARHEAAIEIGDECDLEGTWVLDQPGARIRVGSRTELNHGCMVDCIERVSIGDDVLIAAETYISDNDSHSLDFEHRRHDHAARRRGERDWSAVASAPVWIESKAWIGRRAMILKGVTIGEGAVVAAGSVVTSAVEPWTLVAGVPARPLRSLAPWPPA
jgi:galactoside O-acetyltransferase